MRLTLRTLLAYLDGILEANDAQDVGKKVEDSEFASGLVQRIQDVVRRLRLGAPSLTDRGPRLDSNTVAEYLDNTLPSEQVADFEKVCLESDVHLAEVASCHQILTLVLGEPAEIDPDSRQRIYRLQKAASGSPQAEPSEEQIPPPSRGPAPPPFNGGAPPSLNLSVLDDDELDAARSRMKPTVPEYLRDRGKKKSWAPVAAVAIVIVCLTCLVLLALGQLEPGTPIGRMLASLGILSPAREIAAKSTDAPANTPKPAPAESPAEPQSTPPLGGSPPESPADATKMPDQAIPPPVSPAMPDAGQTPAALPAPDQPAASSVASAEDGGALASKIDSQGRPSITPPAMPTLEPKIGSVEATAANAEKLPPEPIGRLMSADQVLLRYEAETGWTRVSANQMLMPGRFLVLPTYRIKIALSIGVTLDLLGGSQFELLGSNASSPPRFRIAYGRVVLMPTAKAGARLQVQFGRRSGEIAFDGADSVAAIEARRVHAPGANPEEGPPNFTVALVAASGNLTWNETGGERSADALRLAPAQAVFFEGELSAPPAAVADTPPWIAADPIKLLDRQASAVIAQSLDDTGPARVRLLELTSRPQKEVRWLALRCLGYLGNFQNMVTVLNEPSQKLVWNDYIEQLCEAVDRDAESAAAVRQALENQYPQQAGDLYRMLRGYSNADLQSGADRKLVNALDDDLLAVRVLAIWNLTEIMGKGINYGYYAEQPSAKRKLPVRRWREQLDSQKIRRNAPEEF